MIESIERAKIQDPEFFIDYIDSGKFELIQLIELEHYFCLLVKDNSCYYIWDIPTENNIKGDKLEPFFSGKRCNGIPLMYGTYIKERGMYYVGYYSWVNKMYIEHVNQYIF